MNGDGWEIIPTYYFINIYMYIINVLWMNIYIQIYYERNV